MSEEFSFRDRGDGSRAIRIAKRWKRGRSKIGRDVFGQMPEIFREIGGGKEDLEREGDVWIRYFPLGWQQRKYQQKEKNIRCLHGSRKSL